MTTTAPAKILIVDDVDINRKLIVAYLGDKYVILCADDGFDALQQIENEQPDLVILDIMMPGLDGVEVCKRIKANPHTQHIPIILVTALQQEEDKLVGLQAGADDFLTKPVNRAELVARVKSHLRSKQLYDQVQNALEQITQKNERAEAELGLARQIQMGLLPRKQLLGKGISTYTVYQPSWDLGGDFYDFYQLHPSEYGIFVADVSGHGAAAAMVTVMLKMILNSLPHLYRSPGLLMKALNRGLLGILNNDPLDTYVTAAYVVINTGDRTIQYSNAGHPPPALCSQGSTSLLKAQGLPLAIFPNVGYETKQLSYQPRARLVLFTDGIYDYYCEDGFQETLDELYKTIEQTLFMPKESAVDFLATHYKLNLVDDKRRDDINLILVDLD